MPAPAVPVPAQAPCSSAEPLPPCEQGSVLGVLRALSLPREHWDVPSPSRASQGDSLAGGFTPWVCVGTAEPAPHPAGLMSLRAAAAGGFAVPSKPGHTPVPSWEGLPRVWWLFLPRCVPRAEQRHWGLGGPGSPPGGAQEWDQTLQEVLFPLAWRALPCLSVPRARNVGERAGRAPKHCAQLRKGVRSKGNSSLAPKVSV